MAESNFDQCFALTLKHEGGYVDLAADPGGATNLGVTIGTLSAWLGRKATKTEVKALTPATVQPIYEANYWNKIRGDDLPVGVDFAVYDFAVHSGPARGAIALQRVLGVADDGAIGSITLAAVAKNDAATLIKGITNERLRFLKALSTWKTFGKGWTIRVNAVQQQALAMAKAKPVAASTEVVVIAEGGSTPALPPVVYKPTLGSKIGNWLYGKLARWVVMKLLLAGLLALGIAFIVWGWSVANGPGSADERVAGTIPIFLGAVFIVLDLVIAFVWLIFRA